MPKQKRIFTLSVSRSDLGRMAPLYRFLDEDESIDLRIVSAGAHGMDSFGDSRQYFEELKLSPSYSFAHEEDESPAEISFAIQSGLHDLLKENSPDYLLILGDRFEMLAASQAALLAGVPILHVGGGHITEGAIDEQCRHAITKLSNRHYVACDQHKKRLRQMGENHEAIVVSGAPDIDALLAIEEIPKEDFIRQIGLSSMDFALVTIHSETHSLGSPISNRQKYLTAFEFLNELEEQVLITAPCQDEGSQEIFDLIEEFTKVNPKQFIYHAQLGQRRYVNAMRHCRFMLGNSSSGIIESASIPVPVINVGDRQKGRQRAKNVMDCSWEKEDLQKAYELWGRQAPAWQRDDSSRGENFVLPEEIHPDWGDAEVKKLVEASADWKSALPENPYGDGHACEKIYQDILKLPKKMDTSKCFIDIPVDAVREEFDW